LGQAPALPWFFPWKNSPQSWIRNFAATATSWFAVSSIWRTVF